MPKFFGVGRRKHKGAGKSFRFLELDQQSTKIPDIVEDSIRFLENEAVLKSEGLFRLSGSHDAIQRLKSVYEQGRRMDPSRIRDLNEVSGLLKLYLRELPEPLLTWELYECFLAAIGVPKGEARIRCIQRVIDLLPVCNRAILRRLMGLLHKVADNERFNKMSPVNLSIVFAPTLLRSRHENLGQLMEDASPANALVETLISSYGEVFEVDDEPSLPDVPSSPPPAGRAPPLSARQGEASDERLQTSLKYFQRTLTLKSIRLAQNFIQDLAAAELESSDDAGSASSSAAEGASPTQAVDAAGYVTLRRKHRPVWNVFDEASGQLADALPSSPSSSQPSDPAPASPDTAGRAQQQPGAADRRAKPRPGPYRAEVGLTSPTAVVRHAAMVASPSAPPGGVAAMGLSLGSSLDRSRSVETPGAKLPLATGRSASADAARVANSRREVTAYAPELPSYSLPPVPNFGEIFDSAPASPSTQHTDATADELDASPEAVEGWLRQLHLRDASVLRSSLHLLAAVTQVVVLRYLAAHDTGLFEEHLQSLPLPQQNDVVAFLQNYYEYLDAGGLDTFAY